MEKIRSILLNKEKINEVIHSNLFLGIVTLLLFISWMFDLSILHCITIVTTIVIASIYSDDGNIIGSLMFLVMISFPILPYFNTIPWYLVVEIAFFFLGFSYVIYKKIKNKTFKFSLGPIGLSMIILPVMCFVCETVRHITSFNDKSEFMLFGYMGVLFVLLMSLAYFVLYLSGVNNKNHYFEKAFYFANIMLIIEFFVVILTDDIGEDYYYNLGWGSQNTLSIGIEMCVPFLALAFMNNNKRIDCIILLILNYLVVPYIASRAGIFTCIILLPYLVNICLKNTKNKKPWIILAIGAFCFAVLIYLLLPSLKISFDLVINDGISLVGRDVVWNSAINFYTNNFVFGGGISSLFELDTLVPSPYGSICFPHNTIITLLCTCGIVGIISFIILLWEMFAAIGENKTNEKYVYIFFVLVGLIHGLFDNTFYSILYMLPLIYIFANKNLKEIEYKNEK